MLEQLHYRNITIGELPKSWGKALVDAQLVDITSGFACAKKNAVPNGLPHLRPFNVTTGGEVVIKSDTVEIPTDFREDLESYNLDEGDVLFNNTNSVELVGKTGIVRQPMQVAFSNHINRLRVKNPEQIDPRWLALALRYLQEDGFFAAHCRKWIGQAGFNQTELAHIEIPMPDVETQRRIVARIEALLAEVREMKALNKSIKRDSGKLFRAFSRQAFDEINKKYPTDRLENLTSKIGSGSTPRGGRAVYLNSGIPFIRSLNVRWNKFSNRDLAYISDEIQQRMSSTKVKPGDVLLNITGASIGRACCVPPEICPANVNQHVSLDFIHFK